MGSGKTSILNMVKENIRGIKVTSKCDSIPYIIDFTPWNFLNQDDIIDQFFNTLLSNFKFSKLKKVLFSAVSLRIPFVSLLR